MIFDVIDVLIVGVGLVGIVIVLMFEKLGVWYIIIECCLDFYVVF